MGALDEKVIAVLATDGFEESELLEPLQALHDHGATCHIVAPKTGEIRAWKDKSWTKSVPVDVKLGIARAADYDGLLIPGGTLNCDKLRMDENAVEFAREFFDEGKPVCAICHGPQILIEAGVVKDTNLTSYKAISTDLINAGAAWVDKEVVVDDGLVTSRSPADLPAFIAKMIEEFAERPQER